MAPPARPSNGRWCILYSPVPVLTRISDSVAVVIAATLLARLGEGTARFELLEDPAPAPAPPVWPRLHCFARIGSSLRGGWSAALNKVEHYGVQRVTGDGRCMFRALAKGMAKTRGIPLTPREEVQDAGSPILCLAH
uniref:Uncharacterized protein n=1 Tax=Triticum urartu TaxID=4572 RepID=A0A8R7Q4D9_TRIUA